MNEQIKDFFDQRASKWDQYGQDDPRTIELFLNLLPMRPGELVLDLACGTGVLTPYLLKRDVHIYGLDLSSKMIEVAKSKFQENGDLEFHQGDFYELQGIKANHIVCYNAFPHFLDIEGFAKKADEILLPHGYLLIAHDRGRVALDAHHDAHASHVSRHLLPVEKEIEAFLPYFKVLKAEESDHHYLLLMQKR